MGVESDFVHFRGREERMTCLVLGKIIHVDDGVRLGQRGGGGQMNI